MNFISQFEIRLIFLINSKGGDASIIPKTIFEKRKLLDNEDDDTVITKKVKVEDEIKTDIYRTGAKCVPNSKIQDQKKTGANYHSLNAVRTKPGRGDPTNSMSCSDKIAKWLVLGIQGSLLSFFLNEPVYLKAIIIAK